MHERKAALEAAYGVTLHPVHNDKAEEWNNAYSLWCARDLLSEGVILANGDTVHPASVERTLLAARGEGRRIILALDTVKKLADEEMKVVCRRRGRCAPHHQAHGPGRGHRRVHRRHAHRAARPPPTWPTR